MKKIALIILTLILYANSLFATVSTADLLNAYESCHQLEIEIIQTRRLRHDALIEFFNKFVGGDYAIKNQKNIENMAGKGNIKNLVSKILEAYVTDKKARARIVATLTLPDLNTYKVNQLSSSLQNMVEPLRGPSPDGYRFAHYSRENGASVEKNKLVAKHDIGSWQIFERTYDRRIFKIRLFSPTKAELFRSNRDVFLDRLIVEYKAAGASRTVEQNYSRMLKRGENLEFNLPEIAQQATVRLSYATRPEHRNKAQFFVEPVEAQLVDNPDSPYLSLIKNINRQNFRHDSLETVSAAVELIKNDLRLAMLVNDNATKETQPSVVKSIDNDKVQYFVYMIKDESISRELLAAKFAEMFAKD